MVNISLTRKIAFHCERKYKLTSLLFSGVKKERQRKMRRKTVLVLRSVYSTEDNSSDGQQLYDAKQI